MTFNQKFYRGETGEREREREIAREGENKHRVNLLEQKIVFAIARNKT